MTATIAGSPFATTNAAGSFNVASVGLIQGVAYPDPALRYELAGGILAAAETIPMWGGVGIYELIPNIGVTYPPHGIGPTVGRATTLSAHTTGQLLGFSVFDQAHSMVSSPSSPVPLSGSGNLVNYYRLRSGIRLAVKCDPALVTLRGGLVSQQVSWDFTNQQLVQYTAGYGPTAITSMAWSSTTKLVTVVVASTASITTGDAVIIAGAVPTAYNGEYDVTVVDGTHFTFPLASDPGTETTPGTYQSAGGGALPVEVISVEDGNSMVVSYNSTTGLATWNRTGTCAVILI